MKTKQKQFLCCLLSFFPVLAQSQVTFSNRGGMYVGKNSSSEHGITLYIPGSISVSEKSEIWMDGNIRIDNDLVADGLYADYHAFHPASGGGKLTMKGSVRQRIFAGDGSHDRMVSYIGNLPVLEVNNPAGVILADSMGLSIDSLRLLKGKFILGSRYINNAETRLAHFFVGNGVAYNREDTAVVEIQMVIGNSGVGRTGKFMGFSPPFKKMYADYFTYNYLLVPDGTGLFGASKKSNNYPGYALEAGHGYIIGQNVYGINEPDYSMMPEWNLTANAYNARMCDTLLMNRYALHDIHVVDDSDGAIIQADAYTSESLNVQDVKVQLKAGYNYLGNPFTCPLNLSALKQSAPDRSNAWGVSRGGENETNKDIYTAFWVMHGGEKTNDNFADKTFGISVGYDITQAIGSTVITDRVAPMQLFLIYAHNDCELTIPASARAHGNENYLKRFDPVTDELLLEVRDQDTEGYDRMCVVFRKDASAKATDNYDAGKIFNTSGGVSQVYTTAPDGADLMVTIIPTDASSLSVMLTPSFKEQEVTLTASRVESLQSPEVVFLEDLKTQTLVDLKQGQYRFTTTPGDNPNRFVLHFKDIYSASTGLDGNLAAPLQVTYHAGQLTIKGLQVADVGSRISITDIQGRTLMQETIAASAGETGMATYSLPLLPGIYVAVLFGNKSINTKFITQ